MISHRFYDKACRQAYRRAVGNHQRARVGAIEVDNTIPGALLRTQLTRTHPTTSIITRRVALPLEALVASQLLQNNLHQVPLELKRYVALICARNVTEACGALAHMVDIPEFVLGDVLTRLPRLARELDLQVDIWLEYGVGMAALLESARVKGYFENLLGYTIGYYLVLSPKFHRFITESITIIPGERPLVVNYVMWQLIRKFYSANIHHLSTSHSLVAVYEHLVRHLPSPVNDLDLCGIASIAMAVFAQLPSKARQLWGRHPAYLSSSVTRRQQHVIDAVELTLCTQPETLLALFNQALARGGLTLWLWLMFLRKLRPLGILTEERAILVMKQLEKHAHDTLVTREIVEAVLATVKLYRGLIAITSSLVAMNIEPQLRSILVPRHIRLLYRHRNDGLRYHPFPWALPETEAKTMLAIQYARHLFEAMPVHTNQAIGEFLDGESMVEPQLVWSHYQRLVMADGVPNATSLCALVRAARKGRWEWTLADGSVLFAPQIAVHQFKRYVLTTRMDQVGWQLYLRLLHQYSYTDELASIIKWWEHLGFVPNRHTLVVLLQLLPRDHALRHIDHYHKVKHDLAKVPPPKATPADVLHWPWPNKDELGPDIGP